LYREQTTMKLILKLVILGIVAFLIFNYSGSHNFSTNDKYPGNSAYMEGANIVRLLADKDKGNETVVPARSLAPGMKNNYPPLFTPEFRKELELQRVANVSWIKSSSQRYSPDTWYMLMQYDMLPSSAMADVDDGGVASSEKPTDTFHYLRGRSRLDLLASMEKNVHEIAHGYFDQNVFRYLRDNNMKMTQGDICGFIYISPSRSFYISFPRKAMFPSHDLGEDIPKELRTYRFGTYIEGNTSTQDDGVIGLLNELHAYYLGSKYCFDMLEPYKTAAGEDAAGLFQWVTNTQSTMSAFYEFDFFIREYLLYMKKHHVADYDMLRSYRPFVESYLTLRRLYKELIDNYQDRIKEEMKHLNSSRNSVARLEKGWLWVRSGKSNVSSGTPLFSKDKDMLQPVLDSKHYREIETDFPE
jgi:hypothetical protein